MLQDDDDNSNDAAADPIHFYIGSKSHIFNYYFVFSFNNLFIICIASDILSFLTEIYLHKITYTTYAIY